MSRRKGLTPEQRYARIQKRKKVIAQTTCPECGSRPDELCVGPRGNARWTPHITRVRVYSHPLVIEE